MSSKAKFRALVFRLQTTDNERSEVIFSKMIEMMLEEKNMKEKAEMQRTIALNAEQIYGNDIPL